MLGSGRTDSLGVGEVHVWIVEAGLDGRRVGLGGKASPAHVLSAEERARAGRYRFPRDRERFELHRASLRCVLARYLPTGPGDLVFDTRCRHCGDPTHGKPTLLDGPAGLSFNRSGAGQVTAIAIGTGVKVGVDLERRRRIAKGGSEPLRAWNRKEAVLKVDGHGVAIDPGSFAVSAAPGSHEASVQRAPPEHQSLRAYQLSDLPIPSDWGYGCVATDLPASRVELFETDAASLLGAS